MNILEHFVITKEMVKKRIEDLQIDLHLALDFEDSVLAEDISDQISQLTKLYFTMSNKK